MNRIIATIAAMNASVMFGVYAESWLVGMGVFGAVMAVVVAGFGDD